MLEFPLPEAPLGQCGEDRIARLRKLGRKEIVDDRADRLFLGPAIKAFAARRPIQNLPIDAMDDDVRLVEQPYELLEILNGFERIHGGLLHN